MLRTYLKDSFSLLKTLKNLPNLPPHTKLFIISAVGMCNNIHLPHTLHIFRLWFEKHPNEVPSSFSTALFLAVLETVMSQNIFQFKDTFWIQLNGATMGTSSACMFATLYYAFQERESVLPCHGHFFSFYCQYIHNIFGTWTSNNKEWEALIKTMDDFGLLF